MAEAQTKQLTYSEIVKRMMAHPLRQSEVPIEHSISLPLPTKRWGAPAYAFFASPAVRIRGEPMQQESPDRWWLISPYGGRVILYALWSALPFAENAGWSDVTIPPATGSIKEDEEMLANIRLLMDSLAPEFFAGHARDASSRKALSDSLAAHIEAPLMPQYRALAPDFFAWLEA